jgi:hypothetical protein
MKHVEFHFQNKFEKLVHLVGFIIRKLHDDDDDDDDDDVRMVETCSKFRCYEFICT